MLHNHFDHEIGLIRSQAHLPPEGDAFGDRFLDVLDGSLFCGSLRDAAGDRRAFCHVAAGFVGSQYDLQIIRYAGRVSSTAIAVAGMVRRTTQSVGAIWMEGVTSDPFSPVYVPAQVAIMPQSNVAPKAGHPPITARVSSEMSTGIAVERTANVLLPRDTGVCPAIPMERC